MQLVAGLLGIASMPASTAQATAPAADPIAYVTVLALSDDPPFPSGIFATFVALTGRTPEGEEQYLIPFMEHGQSRPEPGARCTLTYRPFGYQGMVGSRLESVTGGKVVVRYQCDGNPPARIAYDPALTFELRPAM